MASIMIFMAFGTTLGAVLKGVDLAQKQCELEQSTKDLNEAIKEQTKAYEAQDKLFKLENVEYRQQLQNATLSIARVRNAININYNNFKKEYDVMRTAGLIMIILTIFALAFKKIILDENY